MTLNTWLQESMFRATSPKRKESTPLLERSRLDDASARAKIMAALEKKSEDKKQQVKKNELPMLKYLKTHVSTYSSTSRHM